MGAKRDVQLPTDYALPVYRGEGTQMGGQMTGGGMQQGGQMTDDQRRLLAVLQAIRMRRQQMGQGGASGMQANGMMQGGGMAP